MTLTLEAYIQREGTTYSVTVKAGGIPDHESAEALREALSGMVAQAMADMGARYVEKVSTH